MKPARPMFSTVLPSPRIRASAALLLTLSALIGGCAAQPARSTQASPELSAAQNMAAGDANASRGAYEDALVSYVKAATIQPDSVAALSRIAQMQEQLGDEAKAADAYQRVLKLQSDDALANEAYGLILLRQNQIAAAAEHLNTAIRVNPQSWRAHNALGVIADLAGRPGDALAQYRIADRLRPEQPQILNNLGYSSYLAGDLDTAQRYFRRALVVAPDNDKAWSNLALVYMRQGQYEQAVASFSEIMSAAEAHYSTGYLCMIDHRDADAARQFEQALALSPSYYDAAARNLERVRRQLAARQNAP